MAMPENVVDCSSAVVDPSDPLCERMQGLLNSGATFCSFRNWAFNVAGDEISDEFQDMILGDAEGDLLGSTWPNLIIAPGVVTSAKMSEMTGLTPGPYVNPTMTVDVAGRITAISDGSAPAFGASAQVTGAGVNYTHVAATAFANVVFGTTDPTVALPASGTYLITAVICGVSGGTASSGVQARLYNVTGAAAIADSTREISLLQTTTTQGFEMVLSNIITVGAASITIQVARASGTLLTVTAAQTSISYVRLA